MSPHSRKTPGTCPGPEEPDAIDPALQQQVDENLRLLYRARLEDDLPQALQDLVRQLLNEGKPG